jgi:outer membrane lipoprotein-sorting protein
MSVLDPSLRRRPTRRRFLAAAAGLAALPLVAGLPASRAMASAPTVANLSAQDLADIKRIEEYINAISTLRANFQQYSNASGLSSGRIYLRRPGRLRVEYDPPVQALIVADGLVVTYYDGELDQVTQAPIGSSPLWFLLRDEVSFSDGVSVSGIERAPGVLRISAFESDQPDAGLVSLVFSDQPLQLKQWAIVDSQGVEVRVGLQGVNLGGALANELFATPTTKKIQEGR